MGIESPFGGNPRFLGENADKFQGPFAYDPKMARKEESEAKKAQRQFESQKQGSYKSGLQEGYDALDISTHEDAFTKAPVPNYSNGQIERKSEQQVVKNFPNPGGEKVEATLSINKNGIPKRAKNKPLQIIAGGPSLTSSDGVLDPRLAKDGLYEAYDDPSQEDGKGYKHIGGFDSFLNADDQDVRQKAEFGSMKQNLASRKAVKDDFRVQKEEITGKLAELLASKNSSMDGNVMYEGNKISLADADTEIGNLQKKRGELTQQHAGAETLFASRKAGDDLRYATQKALSEGRNPEEDPIIKSLRKSYETLGREVDKLDLTLPDDVAKNPIAKKQFYENKGLELEAKDRANLIKGNYDAQIAKADLENTEAARNHFFSTAPFETLRSQTDALVEDTNKMREENAKNWENMSEGDRQIFVERFKGRQESIARAKEQLSKMVPDVNKSAEETNAKFNASEEVQKKALENQNLQIEKLNNEMKIKADAVYQRAVTANDKYRVEQQQKFEGLNTELQKAVLGKKDKDITEITSKMVNQGLLSEERVKQAVVEYKKAVSSNDKQSDIVDALGTILRGSMVASQETARGAYTIASNSLRAMINGQDPMPDIAPQGLQAVTSVLGRASLLANPIKGVQDAISAAGQRVGNKILEFGIKNSSKVKSLAEVTADVLEASAQAAKENKDAINKTIKVDPSFEASIQGQVLKTIGEAPWTMAPYAFGQVGIPIAGALNVSRLYSEAREDQDQSYQAKLQDFRSGKIKEEPQAMTEEEAHRGALQYALPAGLIDTVADKIGFDLLKGGLKAGKTLSPKNLSEFFEAVSKSLAKDGEQALPLLMSAPLGGVVESVSETSQQAILNGLATKYKNWDPEREWTQELAQSAIVGGLAGILFPVMGHVSGGVYKKYVTLPQMALDNAGLDQIANEFRTHSQDVETGGWAKFAQAIMPEGSEPMQALGAKALNTPEAQLRGTGVKWVIANGIKIDARLNQLQAEIDSLPASEGRDLRQERNHLLMMRANLVGSLQNDANTRSQLWKEISELPNEPLRKGEQNLHDLALVVAKFSMGAPLTEEEMKMKANGMPIIQNAQLVQMKLALQNRDPAREDGNRAVSPSFMRLIAGKLPTLEAVIESNQALLEETSGVAEEGAVPPKLSEAPSNEEIIAERKAVGEAYDKAMQPTETPSEPTQTAQPSPSMPTWNVAWKRGKASGTSQVSAPTSGQAKLEALKQLKAENLPGQISIGPAEQAEQQDLIPSEQQPLINRAKELARRGSPISVNRYQRRLKGNTPEEKLADAKQRLTSFAIGMKSKYGQTVRFNEDKTSKKPFMATPMDDGSVEITINPDYFVRNDPEFNNRSMAEEIFHAADIIASNLEADKASRTDKKAYWMERRSGLYNKLRDIGRTNETVAKAILSSASLYADLENKEGGLSVDDTIGMLDQDQNFNDAAFMSELLRQLNSVRTTEGVVEIRRAERDTKSGKYNSLKEAIGFVTNYLKQVYRAIRGIRDGLKDNPEVAQELDATLQSIRDVLDEKDTEEPPLDSGLVKKLKDRGLTTAEINKLTPEEAQNRANAPIQGAPAGLNPERLKNQKSNNVRGTKYGGVKFDYIVVPRGKLNNMAGTELQPRNRSGDPDYTREALERANELDPNKLLQGNELDTGAPTVIASADNPYGISQDGFDIIAGHGRNESIGIAPDERRQAYIDEMRRMYPELNDEINAILESGEMPVLVRKINWDATKDSSLGTPTQQLRRIARDANLGTGNSNQTEVSLSDAMEVKDDVTLSAPPEADGSLLDPAGNPLGNREVLDKWFKIFGSPREYKSGNGYTKSFEDRVRNAIVAYTFAPVNENGQIKLDKDTFNLINTLVSENVAKEANLSNLREGLHKASPSLFRVRQKFQELESKLPQEAKDSNPITNIQKAIVAYLGYRSEQINAGLPMSDIEFDKFVNQGQLFGEVITPNQAMILAPMVQKNGENGFLEVGQGALTPLASIKDAHSIKDSPERIAAYLSAYANAIADAYSEYGADAVFPGMERKLTTEENASIIKRALERAGAIYPKGQRAPEPQMPNTAQEKSLKAKPNGLQVLASKFSDEELFDNDENAVETEQEVGATEESVKNAGIVRNIIAPPEKVKRGSGNGEKNERTQPGGKLINSFVRSSIADRFYIRGYSQDELRELAYDKIMDLLSKSPAGQKIAKQYLSVNSEFLDDNLINAKGGAEVTERKEGQMELVKALVARAKSEGNATPTGADLMAFMTAEEKAKGFTEAEIESARAERHLFNYVLRSLTNMVAKMTGNEDSEGKIIAQSQIENRYNNLSPEADTEEMAENMYGNQAGVETSISNIPLEEVYENIERSLQNTTPERMMRSILGNLGGKDGPMDLHARGLSFSQIADELNLTGTQRDDAKVWRSIQEGYQRMQVALDAIRKRKSELESLRNPTEEDEATLDEINEYLGGFSKKDLEAINAKAREKEEFQKALDESRLAKGEPVQQSLFAKVPDARIVTKYYELQDKIRAGEVTPRELDMFDKIESMAIKYNWPGVPVQTRLFELANIMRRTKDSTTQTDTNAKQMELMLDDDTLSGLNGSLRAKTIARMSVDQLLNELEGDWLTEEELQQAMADEEAGKSRGLADYGESENASAGVRASQEATPRPAVKKLEDTALGSDSISDRDILARMREEGVQLSDEETFAARRVSNKLWDEAIDSGDETKINRAFLVTRDYIRSGTEQARGLAARRGRSQEDANRDAIISPILPTENELKKESATQAVKARREASSKRAQVEDAKSKLSKQDQQRPDWKEWFDTQEKEIAEHKKTIADGGRSKAEEVVVDKKRKKAEEALAVTGRSLATLEAENTAHKLRTGDTMNQILSKIGDPLLREAVRMYTQGMTVKDIEKILGKKNLKNDISKAIVNGLQPEVDRRFQRLYEEVAEKKLTKRQLIARLKKLSNGESLMAKSDKQDDEAPLTQEEARQTILEAFGLTSEGLNREKSEQLFNYKDQTQVSKVNSLIAESVDGPASWGKIASDVFASFIFSGAPSLAANVGLTTIAWASVPVHLFAEAITSRLKGDVKIAYGDEIIGTPYKNIGEAVLGGLSEAKSALASIKMGAVKAAWAKACDAFKNEFSSFGEEQGMARQGLTERESGVITKSIPGVTGKAVRAGINLLLSGDEFTKNFRANMYVGAFAYRVGKAKGLSGPDLTDFVESQIADKESIAWDLAVKRTLRDTFGQNLASEENVSMKSLGKTRSIGEGFGIVPQAARNINAGIAKMAQQASQTEGIGNMTIGGRSFSPAEFALRFAQSFFILIKSPYNIARASAAYSPLAGLNVIARNAAGTKTTIDPETGKTVKYMEAEDYEASVQRHTEAMLGMMGMAALWSAFEGDDDDDDKRVFGLPWMPKILITGSSDKGPKTRYGNQATTITVGGYSFPYGRYEPLSGLAYLADLAREAKQIQKGRGSSGARVQQWASDFISYPFSKTFSKSWRDLAKFASVKGVPEVMQNRIASVVVPNFFKRLFEPGAITTGEEEWDSERLSGWSWNEMGGWINATLPGLPSMLSEAGVKGDAAEGLPPRSLADLSTKKRNVAVSETIAKRVLPDRAARLIGGITRGLVPEGGIYEAPDKTRLEKFISAYNARYPQTSYNPKPPNKFVQIKDKDGISKNEQMTPREYKMMLEMASKLGTARINSVLSDENIANPTDNIRKLVDKIREDAVSSAREAVKRARRYQNEKAVEPASS